MKKSLFFSALLFFLFYPPTSVLSQTWVNPPESRSAITGWQTNAPYQRDIYWSFSQTPVGTGPITSRGAVYSGTYGSSVGSVDNFGVSGALNWDAASGRVGFRNPNDMIYGAPMNGSLDVYMGNIYGTGGPTRMYLEYTVSAFMYSDYLENPWKYWDLALPFGSNVSSYGLHCVLTGTNLWLVNMWAEITPNPEWEALTFNLSVPGGAYLWLDDLHIATESIAVPIPSAVWLLGSGLIGLVGIRRKRNKR